MPKKRFITMIMVVVILTAAIIPANVSASAVFNDIEYSKIRASTDLESLKAKAAIVVEASTGSVLFEKNAYQRMPMASITKIMTLLLIMEKIDGGSLGLDDMVTVSAHAQSVGGSTIFLEQGEKHSVRDLIKAVSVASANDASVALAEYIAGTEKMFVGLMNERAQQLGMKDTHFSDCTGLTDNDHYSTAYDITIMARELGEKHPLIHEMSTIWHDKYGKYDLDNTNKLIHYYSEPGKGVICDGLKTGFTDAAGYCMCATAETDSIRVISVVLGEEDTNTRFGEAAALLDYGLVNFEMEVVGDVEEVVKTVPIKKGVQTTVEAVCKEEVHVVCKKGTAHKITTEVTADENLVAPIEKGQKIGEIVYLLEDKEVGRTDLVALNEVKKGSFFRLFFRMILEWLGLSK